MSHETVTEQTGAKNAIIDACGEGEKMVALNVDPEETNKIGPDLDQKSLDDHQSQKLSKRALKRQARAQKFKELKKKRKTEAISSKDNDEAGYSLDEFNETSYYFENGLRKVYPYHYVFATYAKGRWIGRPLKDVLEREFGFSHPNAVEQAFDEKRIEVNYELVSSDYIVKNCDYISHQIHRTWGRHVTLIFRSEYGDIFSLMGSKSLPIKWIGHENPVTAAPIEVIEDNDEVIVVNKPASIPCHPCGRYRYNSLVFILGKEMGKSNLRNIYRLDRLTSGVIILGKTAKSTKRLEDQVFNRQVEKEYVARVVGEFPSETITVDQPLKALSNKLRLQVISPHGKSSQTTFQRLNYNGRSSVVRCKPHTGRTHQIRVHLQYLGHPILNDTFYNSDAWGPGRGKGGVYQVSHETTCARIYQTHHATQWDGGDNPLYYEKLHKDSYNCDKEEMTSIHTPDTIPSSLVENEPSKLETSNTSNVSVSFSPVHEKHGSDQGIVEEKSDHSSEESSQAFPAMTTSLSNNDTSRPKMDPSKWTVDTSCDMCRKKSLEPRPTDLVMFLHALKYKGPGWDYQTQMPDWAREDWKGEEEFIEPSS